MPRMDFDASFERSLMREIESDELPDLIRDAPELGDQSPIITSKRLRTSIYGFSRFMLTLLLGVSRLDLVDKLESDATELTFGQKIRKLFTSKDQTGVAKRWPEFLFGVFLVSFVILLMGTYFQYIYDANKFKQRKLDQYLQEHESIQLHLDHLGNVTKLRQEFEQRAQEARTVLWALGAPFLDWSFIVEVGIMIFTVGPAIGSYFHTPISNKLSGGWLILAPRALTNVGDECRVRTQLIVAELDRFSMDSLSFARTKLEQLNKDLTQTIEDSAQNQRQHLETLRRQALTRFALRLRARHQATLNQLKELALEGRLNPLHRTAACRDRQALHHCFGSILLFAYMHFVEMFLLIHQVARHRGKAFKLDTVQDFAAGLNLIFALEVANISAIAQFDILVLVAHDHLVAVKRLRVLVLRIVSRNEVNFRRLARVESSPAVDCGQRKQQDELRSSLIRSIEMDLLTVIMQNRLYARSHAFALAALNEGARILLQFAIFTPLIFILHSSYVSSELRSLSLWMGAAAVGLAMVFLGTLGKLHQNCIETFQCYWSFVAQLSYFEQNAKIDASLMMETSVAVFTLRRELSDARQSTDRFACRVLSISFTNTNIIRVTFWIFLVFVSLFSQDANIFGESLARISKDPFGLLRFLHEQAPMTTA